jgi:hypothetical protein
MTRPGARAVAAAPAVARGRPSGIALHHIGAVEAAGWIASYVGPLV